MRDLLLFSDAPQHLKQVPQLFEGYAGFAENSMKHLRLERTSGMERHDNFLSGVLTMPECHMTADLMILIPARPTKGSN